jgi:hypothetical protein
LNSNFFAFWVSCIKRVTSKLSPLRSVNCSCMRPWVCDEINSVHSPLLHNRKQTHYREYWKLKHEVLQHKEHDSTQWPSHQALSG